MRLSDIKGERTLEVIAEITDPLCNIAEDAEATAMFRREKVPEGMNAKKFLVSRIRKGIPALLKTHKGDIITILAAIEGVTKEEYAESLNLVRLTRDAIDLLTDEAFGELFTSAQTENTSGSVPENTEDSNL